MRNGVLRPPQWRGQEGPSGGRGHMLASGLLGARVRDQGGMCGETQGKDW